MHITIGMLAYNEGNMIARTIRSLFEQSVFTGSGLTLPDVQWDIVVVPNGCQDDTQARAEQALRAACANCKTAAVSCRVVPLERAGKSHAWNKLVHDFAAPATDAFVMIDADIEFGHPETIASSVQRLRTDSHAWAVVDLPRKRFDAAAQKTLIAKLSTSVSRIKLASELPCISGQFYVMAASRMRGVWMPVDLSVEDGFLQSMVITDNFRQAPDGSRVVRADNAMHHFEGLSRLRDIVNHEVRLTIGTVLNAYLCWDMLLYMTPHDGSGAGEVVRQLNATDPDWYRRMMENQIAIRGRWPIPIAQYWRRLPGWWALPLPRRLAKLPRTLLLALFDAYVMWQVRRRLVCGKAVSCW
jgi:glycosyltransferase involved in cell wall biosynthesis